MISAQVHIRAEVGLCPDWKEKGGPDRRSTNVIVMKPNNGINIMLNSHVRDGKANEEERNLFKVGYGSFLSSVLRWCT